MKSSFFRRNGLSIAIFSIFLICWAMQILAGRNVYNQKQQDDHLPAIGLVDYVTTGHFLEATAENWESDFLQMSMFIWLTSKLFQKGSPESNDPDKPKPSKPITEGSPAWARAGGWRKFIYEHSLVLILFGLFVCAFCLHAYGGSRAFTHEQQALGQAGRGMLRYILSSRFWFESMENWQSAFLSTGSMVVLAIRFRQKRSPESKDVATPHSENE